MDALNQLLDDRDDRRQEDRGRAGRGDPDWLNTKLAPAERLIRFDTWARGELAERLDWAWAGSQKERRIEQCRVRLEALVLGLWKRGWMLDGKALARHIQKAIDAVAARQNTGKIDDFWAYFSAAVNRYVGANAEELREEAMSAGSHVAQVLALIGTPKAISLPELAAQRAGEVAIAKKQRSLRESISEARKQASEKDQLPLL